MKRAAALAFALLAAWPAAAGAQEKRVRIVYTAPNGCPSESEFVSAVTSQAGPFRRASRSAVRVRTLEASITPVKSGFQGSLLVREADGAASTRSMGGTTCDEVFSALSLVAALTIDTGPREPAPLPDERLDLTGERNGPAAPPGRPWSFSAGAQAVALFGTTPNPAWGVAPWVESAPPLALPFSFQLSVTIAASPRASTPAGAADFFMLASRFSVFFTALKQGPFAIEPGTGVAAGILRGRGLSVALPRDQVRPWVDVSLGARARLDIWPSLALQASGGLLFPVTRATWFFEDPDVVVHETPEVGAFVALGLRVQITR
ncbi:MAG: hypothetical protein IPK82_41870 [Polyangiaceae bacterium]|nr:hypothetical protein [Polyangiaceae bacterium]